MKRKITCFCDNAFDVEVPEQIDLDSDSRYLDEILNGTFLNFTCPSCGKKHKPEFPLMILWPSKKLCFEVFPELERGEFYRRKKSPAGNSAEARTGVVSTKHNSPPVKSPYPVETVIGYPEMTDRLAIIRDGFDPAPVEAIKYFLQLKAEEQYPDDEPEIWYFRFNPGTADARGGQDSLEFHIHGIRKNEVAVMKVPLSLYQKTLEDYKKNPKSEVFSVLRVRSYLSVKNTMRPDELK